MTRLSDVLSHIPSFNDMCTHTTDMGPAAEEASATAVSRRDETPAPAATLPSPRRSNKEDDAWPQFVGADIHKVNVADHTRAKHHLYDIGGDKRSIWDQILHSQKLQDDRMAIFNAAQAAKVSPAGLAKTLEVDLATAKQLVAEADTDKDGLMSVDEYKKLLTHYGSE